MIPPTAVEAPEIERTIRATWERHVQDVLEKFAKEGEGGWEYHLRPPVERVYPSDFPEIGQCDTEPMQAAIVYRFVYTGCPATKLGQSRKRPGRFARKAYEVRGMWKGATVVVERFVR